MTLVDVADGGIHGTYTGRLASQFEPSLTVGLVLHSSYKPRCFHSKVASDVIVFTKFESS